MTPRPTLESYEDVVVETVPLPVRDATIAALLARPKATGTFPAIAIGAEATGINDFVRGVAASLARLGYVTIVPDYYRGSGPDDPEDYEDIDGIMQHIGALDFRRATYDLFDAVDHVEHLPFVDPDRVAVWGYCTGATLAMLVACLRPDLAAAVLFYPSQPVFDALDAKKPVHPMDLVWNIACPVLFMYGEDDIVMPAKLLAELRRRLEQWQIEHMIKTYPGAGHAFSAPGYALHHPVAADAAWRDAMEFVTNLLE